MKDLLTPRFIVLSLLVIAAALTRALPYLIPHIWNFTAIGALAIFSGAQFSNRGLAFILPLAAMAISDIVIGNGFSVLVYIGFTAMVAYCYQRSTCFIHKRKCIFPDHKFCILLSSNFIPT